MKNNLYTRILTLRSTSMMAFLIMLLLILHSCASPENVLLFQDIELLENYSKSQHNNPTIREDDLLIITVSATDMDAVRPYNLLLETRPTYGTRGDLFSTSQQQTYLVDNNGNIDFPILGRLNVAGRTRAQLVDYLRTQIAKDVRDPIVNIRIVNYKITVLGEVNRPGSYTIEGERITIPEALGLAGDMTIYGKRKEVIILREVDGKNEHRVVDLTSVASLQSDYYYLKQNDVIYVQPNSAQVQSSKFNRNASVYVSVASLLISVMVLLFK